jgi:hypothetical protein
MMHERRQQLGVVDVGIIQMEPLEEEIKSLLFYSASEIQVMRDSAEKDSHDQQVESSMVGAKGHNFFESPVRSNRSTVQWPPTTVSPSNHHRELRRHETASQSRPPPSPFSAARSLLTQHPSSSERPARASRRNLLSTSHKIRSRSQTPPPTRTDRRKDSIVGNMVSP